MHGRKPKVATNKFNSTERRTTHYRKIILFRTSGNTTTFKQINLILEIFINQVYNYFLIPKGNSLLLFFNFENVPGLLWISFPNLWLSCRMWLSHRFVAFLPNVAFLPICGFPAKRGFPADLWLFRRMWLFR